MKLESVLATCDCQVGQTDRQVDPHGRSLLVAPLAQRLLTHELFEIKITRNKREEEEDEEEKAIQLKNQPFNVAENSLTDELVAALNASTLFILMWMSLNLLTVNSN